jgi:hypothetical protein
VTPPTAQGATFEKYGGAYPWSIINGESFDIKNNALRDSNAYQI